jgi:glucose/arabinose dehydrogenase
MKRLRGCLWLPVWLLIFLLLGAFILWVAVPEVPSILRSLVGGQANFSAAMSETGAASLQLPPGFEANVFAQGLNGPRFIAFGPDGALYVADRGSNRIVTLSDSNGDGTADQTRVFADGLNRPHSLVYHEGAWYVGVPSGIVRLEDTDGDGAADVRSTPLDDLPTSGSHSTRTVEFLPDGRMVLSVGSSCNVCEESDPRRAAILAYDGPEATGERVFANGLRNAVGLAIHPDSGELWATNNGRDLMGDDVPPDAVYIIREGIDYGWPRCHAGGVPDPQYGGPDACDGVVQPVTPIQAHSAPLGLAFYTGSSFPADYWGDLFIAYHGSWNRSVPTGYKVVRLPLDGSEPVGPIQDFVSGWLDEAAGEASGRPVGLAVGPEGALYVSDDKGGFIYRIGYEGSGR